MKPDKIPAWKLERFVLGELPPQELQQLQQRLEQDSVLQAQVNELKQNNQRFFQQHSFQAIRERAALENRLQDISSTQAPAKTPSLLAFFTQYWRPALTFASLVLIALFSLPFLQAPPQEPTLQLAMNDIRTKGLEDRLELWKKTADSVSLLADEAMVKPGDMIQVRLFVHQPTYVAVISLDGRGNWTLHYPDQDSSAILTQSNQPLILPFAYELDHAPRHETFWLLTSSERFSLQGLADFSIIYDKQQYPSQLSLPSPIKQHRLRLLKRAPE